MFTSFDIPNPETVEEGEDAAELVEFDDIPKCVFLAYQIELSASGRYHQQGYLAMSCPTRIAAFKKQFPTVHWEVAKGTHDECLAYVTKEDTRVAGPFVYGQPPVGQGARSDIYEVAEYVRKNPNLDAVAQVHPVAVLRYPQGLRTLIGCMMPRVRDSVTVNVITGPAGHGKTSWPMWLHTADSTPPYILQDQTATWWLEYSGEKVVIIDDFEGKIPFGTLLRLLDRFPFSCPIKGGSIPLQATEIWITSNTDVDQWMDLFYPKNMHQKEALMRRLTNKYRLPAHPPPGWLTITQRYGIPLPEAEIHVAVEL